MFFILVYNGTLSLTEWQPGVQQQLTFRNSPMSYSYLVHTSTVLNYIHVQR